MKNFSRVLFDHYQHQGHKEILYFQSTGKEDIAITYQGLLENAYRYACEYEKTGIKPGDIIILVLQHSVELIYAYYGAILAGAVPSIMPFLTEKLLPEKYQHDFQSLIQIIQPKAIITYRAFKQEVFDQFSEHPLVDHIVLCEDVPLQTKPLPNEPLPGLACAEDDVVLLQHSSGTTGLQKGVALSHKAVFQQLDHYSHAIDLDPQSDVIVSWLPLYHDMGLIACFLMPILCGIPLVMMSPFDWVKAPYRLFTAISAYKGTLCWLPNFSYNFCAKKVRDAQLEGVDLATLRALINCSEPVRYESHQVFLQKYQSYGLKEKALAASYAMAENVFAVTQGGIKSTLVEDRIDRDSLQIDKKAVPVREGGSEIVMVSTGRPIEGVSVKVIDDDGKTLNEREIGELIVKSDCLFSGYYNRADLTDSSFINGWFRTGDYGYIAGGEVFVTGRKKDLIIVGGKNVYPQDLEVIAMEVEGVHPGRVVAFGIFNESAGTEDVVIVAEADDTIMNKENIANAVKEKVTRNSAIALRHVLVVDEKWLIKTSSGKIARSANKDKYLQLIHSLH